MAKSKGSKWGKKLKGFAKGWKNSEKRYKEIFGGRDIPDDTYLVKLQDIGLGEMGEHTVVQREHVVVEGEHKGTVLKDNMFLSTDTGCSFVRRYMKMVGVEVPDDVAEVEQTLADIKKAEPICKVRVKTDNNGYKNISVISVVDEDDEDGDAQEIDLDEMSKKELKAFVKDNDIEIDGYRKMDEDELRDAIKEALEDQDDGDDDDDDDDDDSDSDSDGDDDDDSDGDDDEDGDEDDDDDDDEDGDVPDFDEFDKEELIEFVNDNDIDPVKDLGFKTKAKFKKADEDDLREKVSEFVAENSDDGDNNADEDDELLEEAKIFCGSWDIDIDDDDDLDDIKKAIAKRGKKKPFPKKELDEDEIEVLEKLELSDLVKAGKAKSDKKDKAKSGKAKSGKAKSGKGKKGKKGKK